MTEYQILRGEGDQDERWFWAATVKARSGQAAMRAYLADGSNDERLVAVPARSWKPVTVKVETKTALKFS